MDFSPSVMHHLRETITALHSCDLSRIWMKVKGDDECCMSNVLGYNSDDLISMFMSTNMMTAGAVILKKDKWANILGVGIEWRDHGQDRWCRFINPINDSFNDRSGPGDCNRVELLRKFTAEKVYIGRSSNARINEGCRKTIERGVYPQSWIGRKKKSRSKCISVVIDESHGCC